MVAAPAAVHAVACARRLPRLGVGLHLVLVEGAPALPPCRVDHLVDERGRFRSDLVRLGIAIAASRTARRQLREEIGAQFAAFAATGLPLDHVNAHRHFHLHPVVASLILEVGAAYGLRAIRAPVEPVALLAAIEPVKRGPSLLVAAAWARRMARRCRSAGMLIPDQVFGLAWSGAMIQTRLAGIIDRLPPGLSEIYLHPAVRDDFVGHAPGYRYRRELDALTSGSVADALARSGVATGSFATFAAQNSYPFQRVSS